ncbi:MAG TPA: hypothetical protein VFT95_18795 [Micromonosporaceae bacterium]|nr:hypothetical protein [Micromonosporaceae bacterium]
MTKPRRSDPDHLEQADRLLADTESQRDLIALTKAHPRRMVRNPCGDPGSCTHGCYGTEEEAERVRRTGMMPGEGDPPADRGAGFTPPERS